AAWTARAAVSAASTGSVPSGLSVARPSDTTTRSGWCVFDAEERARARAASMPAASGVRPPVARPVMRARATSTSEGHVGLLAAERDERDPIASLVGVQEEGQHCSLHGLRPPLDADRSRR